MNVKIISLDELKKSSDETYAKVYDLIRNAGLTKEYQQKLFESIADYLEAEIELEKVII